MVSIASLWLPILICIVGVFVASSVIWMALPIHKNDYQKLGGQEEAVLGAVRAWNLKPGVHMFPCCDPETMKNDPGALDRYKKGPWGTITVMGNPVSMGKSLGLWALNIGIVSFVIAYLAAHSLAPGASAMNVARFVGTVGMLGYGGNALCECIWKGMPWSRLPGSVFDAVVYAGITAAAFAFTWPAGVAG